MLFSHEQVADTSGIFSGWGAQGNSVFNYLEWESKLPSLQTRTFFSLDPAYASLFKKGVGGTSFIEEMGMYSVMSATRNCITRIATAWGWFSKANNAIKIIFKDHIALVQQAITTAKEVMAAIELAVNSICWIPIVGWIIKIIYEIAKIITSIVSAVQEARERRNQEALNKNARAYALPMAEWDPDIDTVMCRYMQSQLSASIFNLEWCFMPRYPAKSASDFVAMQQKYNPDDECFSGWLVWSRMYQEVNSEPPGLGFVPGTMNLHASLSLNSRAGADVKDLGDFFPVTRSVAAQLWSQTVKGDSGMTFAVDTDKCKNAWMDYVAAAYGYGLDGIRGWSMASSRINKSTPLIYADAKSDSLRYTCTSCDYGAKGCNSGSDKGRWRTPPGNGHRSAYLSHLHTMFGWSTTEHGKSLKQDDWWETSIPVKALDNLYDRQMAMILSEKCMYLDDSTNAGGSGQTRFRAIRKGGELHRRWENAVTAMFQSGDWKRIDYRDVIPGEEVDKAIRLMLSNHHKTTPEKFFNMDKKIGQGIASLGIAAKTGPTVLGDPEPPKPPPPVEVGTARVKGMPLSPQRAPIKAKGSSRKPASSAPLLIGAAAVGLLFMKGMK